MDVEITLRVNGEERRLTTDVRATVLDVLRERLDLTGSKKGCDHGQCGACTVLLNGRRANGCLLLAVAHQDAEITTIESLHGAWFDISSGELWVMNKETGDFERPELG